MKALWLKLESKSLLAPMMTTGVSFPLCMQQLYWPRLGEGSTAVGALPQGCGRGQGWAANMT